MADPEPTKTCPYCAEGIPFDATVCGHCHSDLSRPGGAPAPADEARLAVRKRLYRLYVASVALAFFGVGTQMVSLNLTGSYAGNSDGQDRRATAGCVLFLAGTGLVPLGLAAFARARGRSAAWAILGLLSCLGVALGFTFLAILPKYCLGCRARAPSGASACERCAAPL